MFVYTIFLSPSLSLSLTLPLFLIVLDYIVPDYIFMFSQNSHVAEQLSSCPTTTEPRCHNY